MSRRAEGEEVAATLSCVASPAASYLTGQILFLDGGFLSDYGVATSALAPGP